MPFETQCHLIALLEAADVSGVPTELLSTFQLPEPVFEIPTAKPIPVGLLVTDGLRINDHEVVSSEDYVEGIRQKIWPTILDHARHTFGRGGQKRRNREMVSRFNPLQ